MSLHPRPILAALTSHAESSGKFATVNRHDPKVAPRTGARLAMSISFNRAVPLGPQSGLQITSGLVEFMARIYKNVSSEPQDELDPDIMDAMSDYMARLSEDFTLGGLIRNLDLLGSYGKGLSCQAGYIHQDSQTFRMVELTIPCIINDLWEQGP